MEPEKNNAGYALECPNCGKNARLVEHLQEIPPITVVTHDFLLPISSIKDVYK